MTSQNTLFNYTKLETERVVLKILTLEDTELVYQHFSDPSVTEFMDIEPCKDVKEAAEIIQFHLDDAGCRWGLFYKENNEFIGTCGFHYLRRKPEGIIAEIGFDLVKAYWGKGLMNEVMEAVVDYGFNEVGFSTLDATVEPENTRSLALMKRLNFVQDPELQDNLVYFYRHKSIVEQ
ncbi:GNAT family N-acetyltransferase [Pseudoneobacillus sp. C159]